MGRSAKLAPLLLVAGSFVTACSGGGASGSTATPAPIATLPATIAVVLTQQYTDTYVQVAVGEPLSITASGSLNHSADHTCGGGSCVNGPAGAPSSYCGSLTGFPAPQLPCWSLIAKIGPGGSPFEVGTSVQFTATTAGTLYLGVNDNFLADNTGSWTAIITSPGS